MDLHMGTDDSDTSQEDTRKSEDETATQANLSSDSSEPETSVDQEESSNPSGNSSSIGSSSSDSAQSIEDMILEFDEQDGLIRDRSLLDPNYVVEEDRIVGRDKQLQEVTKMLRVALGNNRPPNLFLYGPSGTGKSLITKAVCNNISRICETRDISFGTIEVNCQDLDTLGVAVYELAEQAADQAGVNVEVPKHGVATKEKWNELYRIVNENFDSVVFVLDELDICSLVVGTNSNQRTRGFCINSHELVQMTT